MAPEGGGYFGVVLGTRVILHAYQMPQMISAIKSFIITRWHKELILRHTSNLTLPLHTGRLTQP